MSKQFDQLSKDLASGVSRRTAFRRFLAGIGASAAVLLNPRKAGAKSNAQLCIDHCQSRYDGRDFGQCMAESNHCPEGYCAWLVPVCNGTVINGTGINGGFVNGGEQWICVPSNAGVVIPKGCRPV